MRKLVLTLMVALGMMSVSQRAHAQFEVFDNLTEANTTDMATDTSVISENTTQISNDTDSISTNTSNTATNTLNAYTMFTTPTDVQSMFGEQDQSSVQNPMPDPGLSGSTSSSSIVAALSFNNPKLVGSGQTFYGQNNTGNAGTDPVLVAQDTVQRISANIQAMAAANLVALQQRLTQLSAMNTALSQATSIMQVDAISGRIAVESIAVQAQQAQAANLVALATAQAEINRENEAQSMRQEHTKTSAMFAALGLAPP